MKKIFEYSIKTVLLVLLLASCRHYDLEELFLNRKTKNESPDKITFIQENLFPEGIEYNKRFNRFLVSSVTYGTIGQVLDDGSYTEIINDDDLISTLGLH
ncbi:hypothetical protein BH23BAC1_BH23BAC1_16360 [soil metagenome]